jgi:rhamnogalacturonyl hydrolase YesR
MENLFDKIVELADATTKRLTPEKLPWMWGAGLLMHALGGLNDTLGDDRYTGYIRRYADHHIEKGLRVDQSDTLAPIEFGESIYLLTPENHAQAKAGNYENFKYNGDMELSPVLTGSKYFPE